MVSIIGIPGFDSTKKASQEEIETARPLRNDSYKEVSSILKGYEDLLTKLEKDRQPRLADFLQKATEIVTFFKNEKKWWETNQEINSTTVKNRQTSYRESRQNLDQALFDSAILSINKDESPTWKENSNQLITILGRPDFTIKANEAISSKSSAADSAEKAKADAITKRSVSDDIYDAAILCVKIFGVLLYVIVGIRIGAFAANDYLYKPVPYRILAFVFAFLYWPCISLYYIYKIVRNMRDPAEELPFFYSILPIYAYTVDSTREVSMSEKIFGYPDSINLWISELQSADLKKKAEAVANTANFLKLAVQSKELQMKMQ